MPLNAEINVVSLIDVMLLLLVIFMITAPMMQGGVDVRCPKAEARPLEPKSGLVVSVDRAGRHLRRRDADVARRVPLGVPCAGRQAVRAEGVYLRGDAGVPYGVVTQVMAIMRAAGVGDVGLVTDPEIGEVSAHRAGAPSSRCARRWSGLALLHADHRRRGSSSCARAPRVPTPPMYRVTLIAAPTGAAPGGRRAQRRPSLRRRPRRRRRHRSREPRRSRSA